MKKCVLITMLSLSIAILAIVAGCSKTENSESSNNSTSNAVEPTTDISNNSTVESADNEPLSDDVKKLLEKYPNVAEYIGQDGNVMQINEITDITYTDGFSPTVTYGLGYRFSRPKH